MQTQKDQAREKEAFQVAELEFHNRLKEIGDRLEDAEKEKAELRERLKEKQLQKHDSKLP